jgi:phosphoribosylformylglycinamidine cyclo-ligase
MYDTRKPHTGKVLEMIKQTWDTPYCKVEDRFMYPAIKLKGDYWMMDHTDGIGTKGHYHWELRTFRNAALDALAMNLNDLAMCFANPIKLQNHIFLPEDDNDAIFEIIDTLVEECRHRGIAMTGGETSIHNNMNGMDISMTVTGIFRGGRVNKYMSGDVLVGLKSSGLHSNGFTKVHQVLEPITGIVPEFVVPTRIYEIQKIHNSVNMVNHITGGAYTKLLPYAKDVDLHFDFDAPKIFHDLAEHCSSEEMYKTFNCGYGFVLSVPPDKVKYVINETGGCIIGHVEEGSGKIVIKSAFYDNPSNSVIVEYQ